MKFPSFVKTPAALVCGVAGLAGLFCLPVNGQGNGDRTAIAIEALSRLKGIDLESSPAVKAAVLKVLASTKGTAQFVELVRDFRIKDQNQPLLEIALAHPDNSTAVEATRLVLENQGLGLFEQTLASSNTNSALKSAELLGHLGEKQVVPILEAVVIDPRRDATLRKRAVRSLAQTQEGAAALLKLAQEKRLSADMTFTAGAELQQVRWPKIRDEAAQLLPLAPGPNAEPLPPFGELLQRVGDPARGAAVFTRPTVGCANCHEVNGRGVDFGPKLSEVGTKLGKDALFEAILDPNSGISFGYEAWQIDLKNGDEAFGLVVSETAEELSIKTQTGIVTRLKKSEVARRTRMTTSIMPSGLQQTMSIQDLVDLVEYLASLKKPAP